MSKPRAMTSALNYYRQLFRRGLRFVRSHNHRVSVPTLLIWGEQDIALDFALTTGLDAWVPDLTIKRIHESGHWVQQEQPELVNQYMLEFLHQIP